jgi:Zn-dependent M28 family amino/carboxypeptidase
VDAKGKIVAYSYGAPPRFEATMRAHYSSNVAKAANAFRSDQYSFVRQGVPSVFLSSGKKSSDPRIQPEEIRRTFLATRYHKPQDDMNQPFDFESGAKFARSLCLLEYLVAQKTERPVWNPGDFFGGHYGKRN